MAHNIRSAGSRMRLRHGKSIARIHHRELRHCERNFKAEFFLSFKIGNNGSAIHFGTGCGKGQNSTERKYLCCGCFPSNNVPRVAVIVRAGSNRFSAVDGTSSSDRKDKIQLMLPYQCNSLFNFFYARIRGNAGQFRIKDTFCF